MKRITVMVMNIVLISSCGNNTKESNAIKQKPSINTEKIQQ